MLKLRSIFSDCALFQQQSRLDIHGQAAANIDIQLSLMKENAAVLEAESVSDAKGAFVISFLTPPASMERYSIVITAKEECVTLSDILFGELFLASGQSNMGLENQFMTDCIDYLDEMRDMPIRCYAQETPTEFTFEPNDSCGGRWIEITDQKAFQAVSAVATAFSKQLYERLTESGEACPVGFLSVLHGATQINGWVSREALENDPIIRAYETKMGTFPTKENWNTFGENNFHQLSAMYNTKIYPLIGIKLRGVLWYQGENECDAEYKAQIYQRDMQLYYKVYSRLFAPCDGKPFMMNCCLLYPFYYGGSGETNIGWLNQAIINACSVQPEQFCFVPTADLTPSWCYGFNHPIHPTNKYTVGERLANLVCSNTYGHPGQISPATLESYAREKNRILIRFRHVGSGLWIDGKSVRGIYIAGRDGLYLHAQAAIVSQDTLAVYHPHLPDPMHVAYAFADFEAEVNLWAGEYPVAPFSTQQNEYFRIEGKPWLDLYRDNVWENRSKQDTTDYFYHPIYKPCAESEVCKDTALTLSGMALHIGGTSHRFGTYVTASVSNRLDLMRYRALRFLLLNCPKDGCQLELLIVKGEMEEVTTLTLPAVMIEEQNYGWKEFEVSFAPLHPMNLPIEAIKQMRFWFDTGDCPYAFVNMEQLQLLPGQTTE